MSRMSPPPVDPLLSDSVMITPVRWPKVVGVTSICLGSLGLLCNGCGGIYLAFVMPKFMKMAEEQMGPPPAQMLPSPAMKLLMIPGVLIALLLLYAGITCVARKPLTRVLHLTHATISILFGTFAMVLQVRQQMDLTQWAKENPGDKWAAQVSPIGALIGMAIGFFFTYAWPLFSLLWFSPKKRLDDLVPIDAV